MRPIINKVYGLYILLISLLTFEVQIIVRMNALTPASCPVDFIAINENKARLTALQIFVLTLLIAVFVYWPLIALIVIDFFLRSFDLGKYSVLAKVSDLIIRKFSIGLKPVDQAPKRFAARIGLGFSIAILLAYALGYSSIASGLAIVLVVFSFLESFFSFCAGCHVYTLLQKIFPQNSN